MSDITKVHAITLEQAQMLIGREVITYSDDGDSQSTGVVRSADDDRHLVEIKHDGPRYNSITMNSGDGWYIGVIGALPWEETPETPETLTQRAERLRVELADVEAEIARGGLPRGMSWDRSQGGPAIRGVVGGRDLRLSYNDRDRQDVYVEDDGDFVAFPTSALFAWVDRVREETPE